MCSSNESSQSNHTLRSFTLFKVAPSKLQVNSTLSDLLQKEISLHLAEQRIKGPFIGHQVEDMNRTGMRALPCGTPEKPVNRFKKETPSLRV